MRLRIERKQKCFSVLCVNLGTLRHEMRQKIMIPLFLVYETFYLKTKCLFDILKGLPTNILAFRDSKVDKKS